MKLIQFIKSITLVGIFVLTGNNIKAQQSDTTQLFEDFLAICTEYQTISPLNLSVHFSMSSNLILSQNDTLSITGSFMIDSTGNYFLQMGDVEQFISDSLSISINHHQRDILVTDKVNNARAIISGYIGNIAVKSSVSKLEEAFLISLKDSSDDLKIYTITSRQFIPETNFPRQMITMIFDEVKREPVKIKTINRMILPIQDKDTSAYQSMFEGNSHLLNIPEKGWFFIKENITVFDYLSI